MSESVREREGKREREKDGPISLRPRACKLAGRVEQILGFNFYIKGNIKKLNSKLSNQVLNSPITNPLHNS